MLIQSWSKTGIAFDLYLEQNRIRFLFKFNLILIKYLTKFGLKADSKLEQSFNYLNLDQNQIRFLFKCGSSFDYILEKIWIKGWSKTGADFALNLDQTRIIFWIMWSRDAWGVFVGRIIITICVTLLREYGCCIYIM